MKICELKDNWESVRSAVITKKPYIACVLAGRGICVEGKEAVLKYRPEEFMIKKIAHRYIGTIYEELKEYIDDEFKLVMVTEGQNEKA